MSGGTLADAAKGNSSSTVVLVNRGASSHQAMPIIGINITIARMPRFRLRRSILCSFIGSTVYIPCHTRRSSPRTNRPNPGSGKWPAETRMPSTSSMSNTEWRVRRDNSGSTSKMGLQSV